MITLPKPTDDKGVPYRAEDVVVLCNEKLQNHDLRRRCESVAEVIRDASNRYDVLGQTMDLHEIERRDSVSGVVKNGEMKKLYSERFAQDGSPGRPIYWRIRSASPNDRCPYCCVGVVRTLDHYLPKAHYTEFTVTPNNLVPACERCQKVKLAGYPESKESQNFHPYFDNFEDGIWLGAEVIQGDTAVFEFKVVSPPGWSPVKIQRAVNHFKDFGLSSLYSGSAADELSGIRGFLDGWLIKFGASEVREYLREMESSRREGHRNTWQAAFYAAAADSEWFCGGGFRKNS